MWPAEPLEYSAVQGDADPSTRHFGVVLPALCPCLSLTFVLPSALPFVALSLPFIDLCTASEHVSSTAQVLPAGPNPAAQPAKLLSVLSVWFTQRQGGGQLEAQFRKFCTDQAWQRQVRRASAHRWVAPSSTQLESAIDK